ncbi:GIY-YIG nuclease family protein [Sporosarcina sp. 179-K 8C2 HS]|uniref:GIY-YIG nuclease family protein n=1 Tax=Sporosarcina sp. 179-K 8C2 HS TaxID=3142387 RepID=UPI00399F6A8D
MTRRRRKNSTSEQILFIAFALFFAVSILWQLYTQNRSFFIGASVVILLIVLRIFKWRQKRIEKRRQELLSYNSETQKKWVQKMIYSINRVLDFEKFGITSKEKAAKRQAKLTFYELYNERELGYVYVIQEEGNGLIKIGKAKDPMKRIPNGLGAKNPYRLKVVHLIPTNFDRQVEGWLHRHFEKKRMNGEWFRLSAEDLSWIKEGDYPLELLELINGN